MVYDFKKTELEILEFWNKNKIYSKVKSKNKGHDYFYFLDGPPYTSGKVHIGTAWNKALKDMVLRYKRMKGFDVWDRAGYDMHGLPTENAAQKKLEIKDKNGILRFGVDKFIEECKKLSVENMKLMNEDFKRIGVWMDFDNAYQSIKKEFIESEWWLIKKAHENGRLYEGLRTMTWCPYCETALAKHELEYQTLKEGSVFLKFKIKGTKNEYLVVWTTTAWTIPFNLVVMVNPDLDYVKAEVGNEFWYVAKPLAGVVIQTLANKPLKVIKNVKGRDMEGMRYEHPFYNDLKNLYQDIEKKSDKVFTVILSSEYVDASGGSGLVHAAPGCGPEDYEVCHKYGISPFNTLDEKGVFPKEMGVFSGLIAKKDDKRFIQALKDRGALLDTVEVEHEYAHCQRCHEPVIFRVTKQWFFKVEDLRDKMIEANKKIRWVPDAAFNAFDSWLKNLRDNSITKQRFWGTPLPVWKCDRCGAYDVVESENELIRLSDKKPKDLHKPWIDEVSYKCKCGSIKRRIADIVDVWVDAGTTSWNCLDYPQREDLFKKMFPADFILEGKDQIRGWFNLLMVASMVAMERPSFKEVYMHGFVQDSQGRKMSKSLGNYILPEEVVRDYGADTLRYYMIGGANPGVDINYNFEDMKIKFRNLNILWNLQNFLIEFALQNKFNARTKPSRLGVEEKYMLSVLNNTIGNVTRAFDDYRLNEIPWMIENLFLELSRVYLQMVREKSSVGTKTEKENVFYVLHRVIYDSLKLFSTVAPFISEAVYQKMKDIFKYKEESVHILDWPKCSKKEINGQLEEAFDVAKSIIQTILAIRSREGISVRWPLKSAKVVFTCNKNKLCNKGIIGVIKAQTNLKNIKVVLAKKTVEEKTEDNFRYGYVILDTDITADLEKEGYCREVARRIQDERKKIGLKKADSIDLVIQTEVKFDVKLVKELADKVGAKSLTFRKAPEEFDKKFEFMIKDKKFVVYVMKIYLR